MPSPFPHVAPEHRGELRRLDLGSQCLRGNFWQDPARRDVLVYTPPRFDAQRAYPALLVLAPFAGTGEGLLAHGLSDVAITTRFDRMILDGCAPFIAVLPDVMTSLGGSQFRDSPAIGDYATYVLREVRAAVAAALPLTGRWGAIGRSSGGYGALALAMDAPGELHAVASLAGDMGFDLAYLGDISHAVSGVQRAGGLDRFVEHFWAQARPGQDTFAALNVLAMSCAYSPDMTRAPIPARLPVNMLTGEVDFDVLQGWRAHDPIERASTEGEGLAKLDMLFFDAGDRDEYNLHLGARRFAARLRALGIDHVHEEFSGGHRGTSYRYDAVVPRIIAALER